MSINDLLNDNNLLLYMGIFFVIVMIIAIPAGIAKAKRNNEEIYGTNTDEEYYPDQKNAKIVSRRTAPNPISPTVSVNYVLFEFENGERVELAIKNPKEFGIMAEGDTGILYYSDNKFISFERDI